MFAIIAALWSLFALYFSICNWSWIEYRMLYSSCSWVSAFTVWAIGGLIIWLAPILLFKFFVFIFS